MKRLRITLLAIIITACYSCKKSNSDRNRLIFKNDINSVQDSLIRFKNLLSKLPKRNDNRNVTYSIEDGKLKINDTLIVNYFSKLQHKSKILNLEEIHTFIRISNFLKDNYLTSAYFDEVGKRWRFIYRDFPERTYNDTRDICLLDTSESKSILETDKILEKKNRLYLLAPKDAVID
jgi:hypothetical protein